MADKTEKKSKGFFAGVKRFFGRIGKFFRDTVSEMKKVVWPSKKQIINNTVVVAVVVVVAALEALATGALSAAGCVAAQVGTESISEERSRTRLIMVSPR